MNIQSIYCYWAIYLSYPIIKKPVKQEVKMNRKPKYSYVNKSQTDYSNTVNVKYVLSVVQASINYIKKKNEKNIN